MYSEKHTIEMADSYSCLRLDDSSVFSVEAKKVRQKFFRLGDMDIPFEQLKVSQLAKIILSQEEFKVSKLWKVDVDKSKLNPGSTDDDIKELGGESMEFEFDFIYYFPNDYELTRNKIHIVAVIATTEQPLELERKRKNTEVEKLERKRKNTEVETTSEKRLRRWAVNSAIFQEESHLFYYTEPEGNDELIEMIRRREYVALYGARASGKSTRAQRIKKTLKNDGLSCIYVTLEHVDIETKENFWTTLSYSLARDAKAKIDIGSDSVFESSNDLKINSACGFSEIFQRSNWEINIVIFIDEFDKMYDADENVRSSFLETLRGIKNSKENYAIWSIVAIGTFSILHLKPGRASTSPFNVNEPYRNPNFTFDQVKFLYDQFAGDYDFTIDPAIIKDIYTRTNGHAGLVCLCGRSIFNNLIKEIDEDNKLGFVNWTKLATNSIEDAILDYPTFRRMVDILKTSDRAKPAVDLVRSVFLGFFDFVRINDDKELGLAEFLAAEGVLLRDEENRKDFKMSSVFVDELIRKRVIPVLYNSSPIVPVPQTDEGSLKILDALIEAIRCFDKTIICNSFNRSFKTAHVKVDGCHKMRVPRESVYDTELNRILVNWIVKECNFEVTGQWHLIHADNDERDKHYYSDIIIKSEHQTAVLELLATATEKELDEHFERVLNYAKMLSANEIWIVNFTCEDGATKKPHWPPNGRKFNSVNVVYFFHDRNFKNVRVSARYISSGTFSYITDEVIQLQ